MGLFDKLFGSYSDRELKRITPIADRIEALADEYAAKSDEELRAKTDEFKTLAHQIAMQVASMNPLYVSEADTPEDVLNAKKKELEANFKGPENMKDQILGGQIKKAFADKVLMNQPYILDDTKTVAEFIKEAIAKTGENITIRQFKRIELGVTE